MVKVDPWLSTLRSLAVEVVTLVLCQILVSLPSWGAVPMDSLVLWCSWPSRWVTCLRSGLCSSSVRDHDVAFPPFGGFDFWPSCGVPCLRLTLWASACIGPGGFPAFSRVGPAPSPWVPLLWTWLVWVASTVFLLLCLPSGCGHPLGSIVSFVTIDRERRFPLEVVSFTM